jgi:GNAT superfamily N-acetyltransferase
MSLSLRPFAAADAAVVSELVSDYEAAYSDVTDRSTADDILDWTRRVDLGSVVVEDEDSQILGAGFLRRRGSYAIADHFVRPASRGRGAGSRLLDWGEQVTREAGLDAVRAATTKRDDAGRLLFESRGYSYIRSFYRMVIDLDAEPPSPTWPSGFSVALEPEQEHVLYETMEEAFEDHWGHQPRTFEEWMKLNGPLSERICYLVRTEDGTPAAAQICDEERWGTSWVSILGVREPWRRHGLGEALLRQAFHDLYARGRRRVALGVDAENTTGATRLYERVGMRVIVQDDAYEKLLGQHH